MILNNRYKILRKIGQGASGIVFLVKDIFSGNLAAAKTISQKILQKNKSDNFRNNLKNEYRIISTLNHPNLVKVLDYGFCIENDVYFIIEEYLKGRTLKHYFKYCKQLSLDTKIDIILQILITLEFLHSRGILYRDLNPDNIILKITKHKKVEYLKIIDFGLSEYENKVEAKIAGSLPYIAPEILTGSKAGRESDIYAVGVIFYELLTAKRILEKTLSLNDYLKQYSPYSREIWEQQLDLAKITQPKLQKCLKNMLSFSSAQREKDAIKVLIKLNNLKKNKTIFNSQYGLAYTQGSYVNISKHTFTRIKKILNSKGPKAINIFGSNGSGKTDLLKELYRQELLNNHLILRIGFDEPGDTIFNPFKEMISSLLFFTDKNLIRKYGKVFKLFLKEHVLLKKFKPYVITKSEDELVIIKETIFNYFHEYLSSKSLNLIFFLDNFDRYDKFAYEIIFYIHENEQRVFNNFKVVTAAKSNFSFSEAFPDYVPEIFTVEPTKILLTDYNEIQLNQLLNKLFGKDKLKSITEKFIKLITSISSNPLIVKNILEKLIINNYLIKSVNGWILSDDFNSLNKEIKIKDFYKLRLENLELNKIQYEILRYVMLVHDYLNKTQLLNFLTKISPYSLEEIKTALIILENRDLIKYSFYEGISVTVISDQYLKKYLLSEITSEYKEETAVHYLNFLNKLDELNKVENYHRFFKIYLIQVAYLGFRPGHNLSLLYTKIKEVLLKAISFYNEITNESYANEFLRIIFELENNKLINLSSEELKSVFLRKITILENNNEIKKALKYCNFLLNKLNSLDNDQKKDIVVLLRKAELLNKYGNFDEVMKIISQVTKLSDKVNLSETEKVRKFLITGNYYFNKSNYDEAEKNFWEAIKVINKNNDGINSVLEFNAYNSLAVIKLRRGFYQEALARLKKLLEICKKEKYIRSENIVLGNIGICYRKHGDNNKAMKYYQKQYSLAKKNGYNDIILRALGNIAIVYQSSGNFSKAIELYTKQHKMIIKYENKELLIINLINKAAVFLQKGDIYESNSLLNEALKLNKVFKNDFFQTVILSSLVNIVRISSKTTRFWNYVNLGISSAKRCRLSDKLATLYLLKAEYFLDKKKYDKGLVFIEKSMKSSNFDNENLTEKSQFMKNITFFYKSSEPLCKNNLFQRCLAFAKKRTSSFIMEHYDNYWIWQRCFDLQKQLDPEIVGSENIEIIKKKVVYYQAILYKLTKLKQYK